MSDKSTKAEEPERSLTFQLQTGGTSGVRPSLAEMWIEDVVRRQEVGDETSPPGFYFCPEQNPENPILRVVENTAKAHTTAPPIESSASTITVSRDTPFYVAPASSAGVISVRSPVPGQGSIPTGRVEKKNSWLALHRNFGEGLYTVGIFFDHDVAPGPGIYEDGPERYRLYLDTCDRYTWIYHKDLKEMAWPGCRTDMVDGEPYPTRDWPAYREFQKPKGIDYDLGMLKGIGKAILLPFSDGAKAAIYLAAPESRMNFETSARDDLDGMNHVSIGLRYGVAVAANYTMASQRGYHGALGLALGNYPAPNSAIKPFFLNLKDLGIINLNASITIRILAENHTDENPFEMFSYVHFGKKWLGPNEPHWTPHLKVVKSGGPGGGFHDWAVILTRVLFARTLHPRTKEPISDMVYELPEPLLVQLDTGSNHTWLTSDTNQFLQKGIYSCFKFRNGEPEVTDDMDVVTVPQGVADSFNKLRKTRIGFGFQSVQGDTSVKWARASSFFLGGRADLEESAVKAEAYETCVRTSKDEHGLYTLGLNFFQSFVVRLNQEIPNVSTIQLDSQQSPERHNLVGSRDNTLS